MKESKMPEEAATFVNHWADHGFASFKAYNAVVKAMLTGAIDAAHRRELQITGHLCVVT